MVEEWCGPLQWIDNRCCTRRVDSGDSSDSDDSHGGEPPLFTVEDDWCNNFDEEGEDGKEATENEEEKLMEYDEVPFVQETIGVIEENLGNDYENSGEKISMVNVTLEKGNELNDCSMKEGEEERIVVEREESVTVHLINSDGNGGAQPEKNNNVNENSAQSSISKKGGCEEQKGVDGSEEGGAKKKGEGVECVSPTKGKKQRKSGGPVKRKKKEKKKSKKEKEAHDASNYEAVVPDNQFSETQAEYQSPVRHEGSSYGNSQTKEGGVVRNSINKFKPASSATSSTNAAGANSHVESIGDSGILMGNRRFETEMEKSKATKLWRLAKENLGVTADSEDDELYLRELEQWKKGINVQRVGRGKYKVLNEDYVH